LCIFGISSYNFVHFWKFLVGFCAFLFISSFHFFSTKYVFLQHAYWLIAAIAGCNHFKTYIRVTRHRLMRRRRIVTFVWRRCPSLGLSQIIFMIWYDNNFYCK
jgi:hypothetical protein